jgi:hypothetical protein
MPENTPKGFCRIYVALSEGGGGSDVVEWAHGWTPGPMPADAALQQLVILRQLVRDAILTSCPLVFSYVQRDDSGGFVGVFPMLLGPDRFRTIDIWAQHAEGGGDDDEDSSSKPAPEPPPAPSKKKSLPKRKPDKVLVPAGYFPKDSADWWKGRSN